jgi:cyclohexa-1,5-dienecarbonyl-CoA hydratase
MDKTWKHIAEDNQAGVVRLTLDRPPLNVLNIEMLGELNRALERLASDQSIRLVVLTGKGKAFSAGVDIAEHLPDSAKEMLAAFRRTCELLAALEAPTICAVNGAALGGGCEIAVSCDITIAAAGARLGQPEIKLATLAPIAAALLPRLCGRKRALELLLSGESITAADAAQIGLISRAVPDHQLQGAIDALIARLSALSPRALRITKRAIRDGFDRNLHEAVSLADAMCLEMLLHLDDTHEGLRAFLEKRAPLWKAASAPGNGKPDEI